MGIRSALGAGLAMLLAVGAVAGPARTRIEGIDARGFPGITAAVQAKTSSQGEERTARDFTLHEDGAEVADFQLEVDQRPVYLSLVLDESGSMRGSMPALQAAATEFLASMDPRVHCQLVTFATEVRRHTGFLAETRSVRRAVSSLRAKGATRLYDAMYRAVDELAAFPQDVRRVVVVFTDGRDERSKDGPRLSDHTAKDVARAAVRNGVPLYFLGLGSHLQADLLERFAQVTGGEAVFTHDPSRLREAFARMARSVQRTYRLRYSSPRPARDGSRRKVQVVARRPEAGDLHFQGSYLAPQDLVVGKPAPGCAARRKVVGTLAGMQRYQVRAEGMTAPPPGAAGMAPVETRVQVARSGRAQDVAVRLAGPGGDLSVRVVQDGRRSVVRVGSGTGATLVTQVDQRAAIQLGKDPVRQVFSWLGAGATEAQDAGDATCERYRLIRPGVLQMAEGGTLTYHPRSYLPLTLVTLDTRTGASTTVRFRDWRVGGEVDVQVPDAPTLSVDAQRYAARITHDALGVAGAALRTGVAAGRLGLLAAAYSTEAATTSIRYAGALTHMVSSPEFATAAKAPGKSTTYWTRAASEESWIGSLDQAADEYATSVDAWADTLDAQVTADAEAWAASAELAGEAAEAAGAAAEAWASEVEARAADVEAQATELEVMGDELGRSGDDLGALGDRLGDLGDRLGDLGDQLGNLGGGW